MLRLAKVYAAAEKYGIIELKNTLIDLLFRMTRAIPRPKPPTYTVLRYVYNTTPTSSPLRSLLVAWYTWHIDATWYETNDILGTLYEIPDFAAELAYSNGTRMSGLVKSSPFYVKPEVYHEDVPKAASRERNGESGTELNLTSSPSKDSIPMPKVD